MSGIQSWVLLCHRTGRWDSQYDDRQEVREKSRSQAHCTARKGKRRSESLTMALQRSAYSVERKDGYPKMVARVIPILMLAKYWTKTERIAVCSAGLLSLDTRGCWSMAQETGGRVRRMSATVCLSRIHASAIRLSRMYLFGSWVFVHGMSAPGFHLVSTVPWIGRTVSADASRSSSPDDQGSLGSGLPGGPRVWSFPRNQFPFFPSFL